MDEGFLRPHWNHSYDPPSLPPSLPSSVNPELDVWSGCITFTAPPFFPSKEEEGGRGGDREDVTYTFAVFGDMGTAEEDGSTNMGGEEVSREVGR